MTDKRWRPGMTLPDYAEQWVDMAPHIDQLTLLASECQRIVEFGVRGGVSTWALLEGLPENGELISLDIDRNVPSMLPAPVYNDERLVLLTGSDGNSHDFHKYWHELGEPAVDMVLIDASHVFEDTLYELVIASETGARRILMHDFLDPAYPGVPAAAGAFCATAGWRVMEVYDSHWGLAVLEKP